MLELFLFFDNFSYTHGSGIDELICIERINGASPKKSVAELYYYHYDGLGSVIALSDQKGKTVESYSYDSFGNLKRQGNKTKNRFTYTGREWDKETGFYYYRARYYDPKIGRFLSQDPIGMVDGPNLYTYVNNNPVNFVDPWGWCGEKKIDYWNRYSQHLNRYLINPGPTAIALFGGLWPKSWAPATGGRPPAFGSRNPLTSVLRAFGVPGAGSAVVRGGAITIGVVTVAAGYYNVGVFVSGFVYAAFPDSNGL